MAIVKVVLKGVIGIAVVIELVGVIVNAAQPEWEEVARRLLDADGLRLRLVIRVQVVIAILKGWLVDVVSVTRENTQSAV